MRGDESEGARLIERIAHVEDLGSQDTLDYVYAFQAWYQRRLGYELGGVENARRNVLYAFKELAELLDELPWKWHRKNQPPVDRKRLVREFADLLVFSLNVLLHCGVGHRELRQGVVDTLAKNLMRLEDGTNVAA